ncbi:MAG: glycoside hydrolase family 127 protein, partial [Planctomycetota bacterium]
MKHRCLLLLIAATTSATTTIAGAGEPKHRKLSAVPFTEVKVQDAFWAPRIRTNREKSLPHTFRWCEKTGRLSNFAKAAGQMEGEFEGIYFNDSDVHKVLEGASYSLADRRDPALEKTVDDAVAKIAAAQQPNGYLNSYYTLKEPDKKWTNLRTMHELYCAGHLIEGAVAHYRATGKRTLLDVAVKFADRIDEIFGPEKRHDVPGHEELELALVRLYELTGEERYFNLAKFFLDVRGDKSKRPQLYGAYCQDHVPVRQQSEIVGHAVRAMYLYSGVADVAGYTGDREL